MIRTSIKNQSSKLSSQLIAQLLRRSRKPASKQASCGFTLVELLVVVVILGVLGAVGVPAYFAQVNRARVNTSTAAALAAAKSCTASWVTGDAYVASTGVGGTCTSATVSTFTPTFIPAPTAGHSSATVAANGAITVVIP